jgi:hypothetical protein
VITAHLRRRALERKGLQRILPKGGEWGLFGWHTVPPVPDKPKKKKGGVASNSSGDSNSTIRQTGCANHERILITEGEYDCLAAAQAISALPADHPLAGLPVVSLPNGCSSLPVELLPRLERFKQVYLWLDNDEQGQASVAKFVAKLGGAVFIRILVCVFLLRLRLFCVFLFRATPLLDDFASGRHAEPAEGRQRRTQEGGQWCGCGRGPFGARQGGNAGVVAIGGDLGRCLGLWIREDERSACHRYDHGCATTHP